MIKTTDEQLERLQQGDILSDVEYIEYVEEIDGEITISKIIFPLVMVLTQDCDLTWDHDSRTNEKQSNHDKYLFSVNSLTVSSVLSSSISPTPNSENFNSQFTPRYLGSIDISSNFLL